MFRLIFKLAAGPLLAAAAHAAEVPTVSAPNALGMRFAAIQPGEFTMGVGRNINDGARGETSAAHPYSVAIKSNEAWNEQPAHTVRLTKPFHISISETTVAQFARFVEETGYVTDAEKHGTAIGFDPTVEGDPQNRKHFERFLMDRRFTWRNPGFPQEGNHPVVCVSWNDARAFCEWLTKKGKGVVFRLPTEAEWEYATKAGTKTYYSCGDDPDTLYAFGNVADAALERKHEGLTLFQRVTALGPDDGDGFPYTAPVGSLKPNPWGLYDVHGNVWEWTADIYSELHYQDRVAAAAKEQGIKSDQVVIADPTGPEAIISQQSGDWRVLRGGGWNVAPISCRSTMRGFGEASDAFCYAGFRVVGQVESSAD